MNRNIHRFVTINGKECHTISVFDHGLLYGDGVFDSFRVFNSLAFRMDDHLKRLYNSAKAISLTIPCSKDELMGLIKKSYRKSNLKNAFIRVVVTRGIGEQGLTQICKPNVIIIISDRDFSPLKKISVAISKIKRINKDAIDSRIKSLNYLNNILALIECNKLGKDDAILLNSRDNLTEATTSNIFLVKNGKLFTPSLDSGILEGITRRAIIENFPVVETELKINDLLSAEEIFLTGTTDFITCVKNIDNTNFNKFDIAEKILRKLLELSKNGINLG